jgi:hypothetical protein
MQCDHTVREHLHHAKAAMLEAHSSAGAHLRNAMRHMLHAGIAAMDAADARCHKHQHQHQHQHHADKPLAETPPPTT